MLDSWILSKLDPLKDQRMVLLRDPQRMIHRGARAVDGWGEENDFTVLFCSGNLALRERLRAIGNDPETRLLLVDITREDGKLFYPDIEAATPAKAQVKLTLQNFLVDQTRDHSWPVLLHERNLANLVLAHLEGIIRAHDYLREINPARFTDSDLYKIVIGGVLEINPFRNPNASEIRRVCLAQHEQIEELIEILPEESKAYIEQFIHNAPKPFCWLLERDADKILRAFTFSAILRQHNLDHSLLLSNIDPALFDYRTIESRVIDDTLREMRDSDPDQVLADIQRGEEYLKDNPASLKFLVADQLKADDFESAIAILRNEHLSSLIRSLALASILFNLINTAAVKQHLEVLEMLEKQEQDPTYLVLRRPTDQWKQLLAAYRRAISIYQITKKIKPAYQELTTKPTEELDFAYFHNLWNVEKLNRLDYYLSDLGRMLTVGELLPIPNETLWPAFITQWDTARDTFNNTSTTVKIAFKLFNRRFQDLYHLRYTKWILQPDSPVIFTHQYLTRMLKARWDPQSGKKAVVLVFDGLRTDAWEEFVRPVMEERYEMIASEPGSALIPTETNLSRKAISAGALPTEFPGKSQQELELLKYWLKTNMGLSPAFTVVCDDNTKDSGMTVRYNSPELDYIVFNFTDENLHGNDSPLAFIYNSTVREIIRQDVRAVLRGLPANALVFITSDHGFTPMPEKHFNNTVIISNDVVNDPLQVKYSNVRAAHKPPEAQMEKIVSFDIRMLKIPIPNGGGDPVLSVLFPRPGFYFARENNNKPPDRYSHGGVSLAECMIPMVVMGPRPGIAGVLMLDSISQEGSMTEGDPLDINVRVRAGQILETPQMLTLAFDQPGLRERKEAFTGIEHEYRLSFTPTLPEISDADREHGYLTLPLAVTLTHQVKGKTWRQTKTVDLRIRLDTTRLRRRIDSKLDLMMGKMPKELRK